MLFWWSLDASKANGDSPWLGFKGRRWPSLGLVSILSSFVGTGLSELGGQTRFLFYSISSGFALVSVLISLGAFPTIVFWSFFPGFTYSVLFWVSWLFSWFIGLSIFYFLLSSLLAFTCEFLLSVTSDSYFSFLFTLLSAKGDNKSLLGLLSLFYVLF